MSALRLPVPRPGRMVAAAAVAATLAVAGCGNGSASGGGSGGGSGSREPGVCAVHVRVNREAERSADHAWRIEELSGVGAEGV